MDGEPGNCVKSDTSSQIATINYKFCPKEKHNEVVEFIIEHFLKNPMDAAIGVTRELFDELVGPGGTVAFVEESLVIVALDSQTDKIIGAKLFKMVKRGEKAFAWGSLKCQTKKLHILVDHFKTLEDQYHIFERNPNIDLGYVHRLLVVDPKYSRRGIATKLIEMSDNYAIEKNCKLAKVLASNNESQSIFKKLGYETVAQCDHETIILDGKPIFGDVRGTASAFMVKYL